MRIVIQLKTTQQPLEYRCINAYQQGDMFCIYTEDGLIYAYPICNIFRVISEYDWHGKNIKELKKNFFQEEDK